MRLCLVCPYSWSFPGGVVEHVASVASHLEGRGHEVAVVAPNDPLDLRTRMLHPKLGRHGNLPERVTPVGRSLPFPSNGSLANLAFAPKVLRVVRRALRDSMPDVVHVHEPLAPLVSLAALKAVHELGIPAVGTFHANYPAGCSPYWVFRGMLRTYLRALDVRVAVSPTAAATARRYFPGEYRVIPNGIDVDRFRPRGVRRRSDQILFIGRPDARKGLPTLIRALPAVLRKVPEARLVIVGSAPENVKLPKALLSSVEVRGAVDEKELVGWMHESSVLCAPSTGGESFGIVLIEALAAGLPVIASNIPGYRAVVTSGEDGVLVPPGDSEVLSEALTNLLLDPERREKLSVAGRLSAERYDWSRVADGLEEIYLRLERKVPKNLIAGSVRTPDRGRPRSWEETGGTEGG